jgi:hypothetical protein
LGRRNENLRRLGKGNKKRRTGNKRRVTRDNQLTAMFERNIDFGGTFLSLVCYESLPPSSEIG